MALVAALIVLGFCCYGFGAGGGFYFKLVRAPFAAASAAAYYRDSILHVALAHWLGLAAAPVGFRLFVLAWFWAALGYLAWVVERRLALLDAALVLLVLISLPVAMIVYAWTGHPDALTLLLTAVLLFSRRPGALGVVAALGAWAHLAMWLVIVGNASLLRLACEPGRARRELGAVAVGLGIGVLGHQLLFDLCGIHVVNDRFALAAGLDRATLTGYWTAPGPWVLYTLYFAHVLWLPSLLLGVYKDNRRSALALVATQIVALVATYFTKDTTRVFALLAWGPLVYGLVHALGRADDRSWRGSYGLRPLLGVAIVASLLAPKRFAWEGVLHDLKGSHTHLRALLQADRG